MSDVRALRWEDYEDQFRAEWERRYPNIPWNDVRLGYRYGWEQASQPHYHEREWSGVEGDLQAGWRAWQMRYQGSDRGSQLMQNWDDLKGSVQYGWHRAKLSANRHSRQGVPS